MWMNGRQTKTNSKTSPEQSAIFQLVREINKSHAKMRLLYCSITRKTAPPPPGGHFHVDWAKNVTSRETNVLTKCPENWAKNVTSRVFTCFHYIHIQKNAPPTGGHVFHRSGPFSKSSEISIKLMKTAPPIGGHVFQRTRTTFELNQHIIKTNILTNFELKRDIIGTKLLTKFHEDQKRNVPSRETKVLTKFHGDWTKNVTSRVFTCFHYIHIEKNALPTGGHVFFTDLDNFRTCRDINKTNAKIVTSRVFTRNTALPTGGHTNILTNFELDREFIRTKLLTLFHEDRTINVASRVFTNKFGPTDRRGTKTGHKSSHEQLVSDHWLRPFAHLRGKTNVNWAKNVNSTVFTCFHYIHKEKNAPPSGGHVFHRSRPFSHSNVLTNFHDDWAKIVTSRVFTRENCHYIHIEKNAPLTGGHVFSPISTIFELVRDIN
ncbi:hypothetical protein DPMN_098687 [Dreissena polymorpha]|uniref:Uncharacterized protein n=1 Tax=Dreissena polymorpha TaxID=45954 RepID=A0A9D4LF63_DREPO|nr:hypothetical protein DPMN_098687 [Dreissena polymorpha]